MSRDDSDAIKRDILKSALKGQKQSEAIENELSRQGEKLRLNLEQAKEINSVSIVQTRKAAKQLETEVELARRQNLVIRCCRWLCLPLCKHCPCSYCCCFTPKNIDYNETKSAALASTISANRLAIENEELIMKRFIVSDSSDAETLEDDEIDEYNLPEIKTSKQQNQQADLVKLRLERVKKLLRDTKPGQGWRRTLVGPPSSQLVNDSVWYRQIDSSLVKLQRLHEDLGKTLDEQIGLAQMLTFYLNYGSDQLIGLNDQLKTSTKTMFSN